MILGQEALEQLRAGNRRFVDGDWNLPARLGEAQPGAFVGGQEPFAVVLGCSDSRVPVEIVFDQGLGDLFVIRVAGNIVAPSHIGSVEFAASQFGTRLVVVMGHTHCGAVKATLDELRRPADVQSPGLRSIVDRIRPTVQPLLHDGAYDDDQRLMRDAIAANVRNSVQQLRHGSAILEDLITNDNLLVVGAVYSLETGLVEFLDDASQA